jgi:hypothetical protein
VPERGAGKGERYERCRGRILAQPGVRNELPQRKPRRHCVELLMVDGGGVRDGHAEAEGLAPTHADRKAVVLLRTAHHRQPLVAARALVEAVHDNRALERAIDDKVSAVVRVLVVVEGDARVTERERRRKLGARLVYRSERQQREALAPPKRRRHR